MDADFLKELREQTKFFLKLDVSYIIAAGTVVTALKISSNDLIYNLSEYMPLFIVFSIIGYYDVYADSIVFKNWFAVKTGAEGKSKENIIRNMLDSQPQIHYIFIAMILWYFLGVSSGRKDFIHKINIKAQIQNAVQHYIEKNGKVPNSIEDVENYSQMKKQLNGEPIALINLGGKKYTLTFGGYDKKMGSDDDQKFDQDVTVQKVLQLFMDEDKRNAN